jgi:ribose transport system substrate-binding protein
MIFNHLNIIFGGCSMKKWGVIIPVFGLVMVLVSCTGSGSKEKNTGPDNRVYGVSVMSMYNPFFVKEVDGVRDAVKNDKNVTVLDPDPANDITTQISQIGEFIAKKVDVIICDPIDSDGIKPSLVDAQRAGIPFINIDSLVGDPDLVISMIVSDNVDAGRQAGKMLADAIGASGEIAIVNWSAVGAVRDRVDGLKAILSESFPGIRIVADQDAYGVVENAQNIMDTFIQAHPNLKGVFGINNPTVQGCVAAIEGANLRGKILAISVDGSQNEIDMIKEGQLLCSPMQQPFVIGQTAVDVAKKYWAGQSFEKLIVVPIVNIHAGNWQEYDGKTY